MLKKVVKLVKNSEIRELTNEQILAKIDEYKEELFNLRLSQATGNLEKPSRNVIILNATADAGTKELFWFSGASFIARTKPGEKYEWRPEPGEYELTVLDDKGRSSSRKLSISTVAKK